MLATHFCGRGHGTGTRFDHVHEEDVFQYPLNMKTFIDVGAHVGTYTCNIAPFARRTYAFEAQRDTFYRLCGSISLNNLSHVHAFNVGLGSQDESGYVNTLHVISRDGGGSTFHPETIEVRNEHIISTEEVEMMALDEYELDEDVGLIKIDVEGHELSVMRGGIETDIEIQMPHFVRVVDGRLEQGV